MLPKDSFSFSVVVNPVISVLLVKGQQLVDFRTAYWSSWGKLLMRVTKEVYEINCLDYIVVYWRISGRRDDFVPAGLTRSPDHGFARRVLTECVMSTILNS